MSQTSSSTKATTSSSSSDQDSRAITTCIDSDVLEITPLREIASDPSKVKKLRTRHAGRAQATASSDPSHPCSSVPGISVPLNQSASPNVDVSENVVTQNDNIQNPSEKTADPPIIDVDEEYSDNDLIANINPSIARRMMAVA